MICQVEEDQHLQNDCCNYTLALTNKEKEQEDLEICRQTLQDMIDLLSGSEEETLGQADKESEKSDTEVEEKERLTSKMEMNNEKTEEPDAEFGKIVPRSGRRMRFCRFKLTTAAGTAEEVEEDKEILATCKQILHDLLDKICCTDSGDGKANAVVSMENSISHCRELILELVDKAVSGAAVSGAANEATDCEGPEDDHQPLGALEHQHQVNFSREQLVELLEAMQSSATGVTGPMAAEEPAGAGICEEEPEPEPEPDSDLVMVTDVNNNEIGLDDPKLKDEYEQAEEEMEAEMRSSGVDDGEDTEIPDQNAGILEEFGQPASAFYEEGEDDEEKLENYEIAFGPLKFREDKDLDEGAEQETSISPRPQSDEEMPDSAPVAPAPDDELTTCGRDLDPLNEPTTTTNNEAGNHCPWNHCHRLPLSLEPLSLEPLSLEPLSLEPLPQITHPFMYGIHQDWEDFQRYRCYVRSGAGAGTSSSESALVDNRRSSSSASSRSGGGGGGGKKKILRFASEPQIIPPSKKYPSDYEINVARVDEEVEEEEEEEEPEEGADWADSEGHLAKAMALSPQIKATLLQCLSSLEKWKGITINEGLPLKLRSSSSSESEAEVEEEDGGDEPDEEGKGQEEGEGEPSLSLGTPVAVELVTCSYSLPSPPSGLPSDSAFVEPVAAAGAGLGSSCSSPERPSSPRKSILKPDLNSNTEAELLELKLKPKPSPVLLFEAAGVGAGAGSDSEPDQPPGPPGDSTSEVLANITASVGNFLGEHLMPNAAKLFVQMQGILNDAFVTGTGTMEVPREPGADSKQPLVKKSPPPSPRSPSALSTQSSTPRPRMGLAQSPRSLFGFGLLDSSRDSSSRILEPPPTSKFRFRYDFNNFYDNYNVMRSSRPSSPGGGGGGGGSSSYLSSNNSIKLQIQSILCELKTGQHLQYYSCRPTTMMVGSGSSSSGSGAGGGAGSDSSPEYESSSDSEEVEEEEEPQPVSQEANLYIVQEPFEDDEGPGPEYPPSDSDENEGSVFDISELSSGSGSSSNMSDHAYCGSGSGGGGGPRVSSGVKLAERSPSLVPCPRTPPKETPATTLSRGRLTILEEDDLESVHRSLLQQSVPVFKPEGATATCDHSGEVDEEIQGAVGGIAAAGAGAGATTGTAKVAMETNLDAVPTLYDSGDILYQSVAEVAVDSDHAKKAQKAEEGLKGSQDEEVRLDLDDEGLDMEEEEEEGEAVDYGSNRLFVPPAPAAATPPKKSSLQFLRRLFSRRSPKIASSTPAAPAVGLAQDIITVDFPPGYPVTKETASNAQKTLGRGGPPPKK